MLLLFGAAHSLAVYKSNFRPPDGPEAADLVAALKGYHMKVGPVDATAWDTNQILSSSYSILLFFAGAANLLMLKPASLVGRLRGLTILNLVLTAALGAVTVIWTFPPPMFFALAALFCFLVSLVQQARAGGAAGQA